MLRDDFSEKNRCVCPICGKKFMVFYLEMYVYKKGRVAMCSYTCFRKAENMKIRDIQQMRKNARRKKDVE